MNKILSIIAASILVAAFSAMPSAAADVDIKINTGATDVLQLNLGADLALNRVELDQTNAINVATVVGEQIEDVNVAQEAGDIIQGNLGLAVAFDAAGIAKTAQTNALNVLSADLTTKDWSDLNVAQSATGIIQGNLGIVGAGNIANLSQVNAANVIDLSVNVD